MSNSNPSQDINFHKKGLAELVKEDEKNRHSEWIKKRIEEDRRERYERVLKQYDRIISSITESDILKKHVKEVLSAPLALLLPTTTIDECVEQIRKALNNEWRDEFFLRYFEKNYWKKEISSNLRIQRGGANALTGGVMEDAVLQAFYYFLVGSIKDATRGLLQATSGKSVSAKSLAYEWGIRSAILQTLYEIYENVLLPIIKRDSCYYAGKEAKRTLIESNLHETLDINMIPLWKIDPKYRGWNGDRLYTLFEKIKEIDTEHNAGRPSEGIIERREFAVKVLLSTEELFKRVCHSIYKKGGSKPQKKAGLYGACFFVMSNDKIIRGNIALTSAQGVTPATPDPLILKICLQASIFPVKSLKRWAEFFNVSERTFRNRLHDMNEFNQAFQKGVEAVEKLRRFREKY